MRELSKEELLCVDGGASWLTASFLNAASRAVSTLIDVGRSLGTAIRRAVNGSICPV